MRHIAIVACLSAMSLAGGCGLVAVPTIREFPGPVKSVRVLDAQTKATIAGATVHVQIQRHENWFVQMPMLTKYSTEMKGEWESLPETDAGFNMKSRCAAGWIRIWLPLPPVLGPAILDEPYAYLRVAAPDHEGLVFIYSPQNPPRPGAGVLEISDASRAEARIDDIGVLVFYLVGKPTDGAPPRHPPD